MKMPNLTNKKTVKFFVGAEEHTVRADDVGPTTSLNSYLRERSHLTGTKRMCYEGGCGVCIVAVEETIDGKRHVFTVNSCLVSILSCHGWKINTIEGIGNPLIGYHQIQKLLSDNYGSQCGFCSSGMVMSMYALNESGKKTQKEIENSFGGNLCRCTGYRPIMYAFKQLASDADTKIPDIEELKLCHKTPGKICNNECKKPKENFLITFADAKWVKVHILSDLLEVLMMSTTSNYMLVSGNTAEGVYRSTTSPDLYIDIREVEELTEYTINSDSLVIGGNVTLTKFMEICHENSSRTCFGYLASVEQHLDLVAHIPVRNIGSIAGNLMIKYQHNEFQSDIFLLLETLKATLTIVDVEGNENFTSPMNFLKMDMTKKVIKNVILGPLDDSYKFGSYKIMPRAQNAHAMINAGFLVQLKGYVVQSARIVYGAINPTFIHASATEKLLVGLNLFDNSTLQKVFDSLNIEIVPDHILPDPGEAYRKNVAISLFYKFVLKNCPDSLIGNKYKSGGQLLERPVSQGSQEYGTNKDEWPLTQPIPKLEALAQTSGRTKYIMDTAPLPNEVYAAFVVATAAPGSTIVSTDTSAAMALEGVIAYYDKNDILGKNTFTPINSGVFVIEEKLFCAGTVEYYSQPVAIIVAITQELAWVAAGLVKITYDAPKEKYYLDVRDVVNDNVQSRITEETTVLPKSKGTDVKKTITGEFFVGKQYHFHMELQCCKVVPTEDGLDIYPSSQWMDSNQIGAATVLNMPSNKIDVKIRRLGGGFGGKMFRNALLSSAAALAAYKLQVPVTIGLNFEENMTIIGKRYPFYMKYSVDVNEKGVIQYLRANLYSDFGMGRNEPIDMFVLTGIQNGYNTSHWEYSTHTVRTDTHPNCYARAPGTAEGIAAIESIMEHIAYNLNLDPMDVKLANISTNVPQLPKYWTNLQSWADIQTRKKEIKTFNKNNRWIKRGMGIVPMKWTLEVAANYSVLVSIFHSDGGVAISHGGIEMGQGINTKVAQVCAYKFGIPLEKVSIKPSYSYIVPNCTFTGGSLTSEAICYAVVKACDTLLARMEPIRKKMTNPTWLELVQKCFDSLIQLCATGFYYGEAPGIEIYPIYGICSTTVEVDILTGKYQILQVDIIEDLGESMSPLIDIGQIEGAFIMGIGYHMTEEIIIDTNGRNLTNRTWYYKPPGVKDIPINFRIKFTENSLNPVGVLKSKAVAEPPLCLSVTVPLAVRSALRSARIDGGNSGTDWMQFDGPTTVEKTFLLALNDYKQYVLK